MTDRAETLSYRVVGTPKVNTYENSAFRVEIADGLAAFHLKLDLPSLESAQRVVDEFLRSFEGDSIFQGEEPLTFSFERGLMKSGAGIALVLELHVTVAGPR